MKIRTGQTIYESIISVDENNSPVPTATLSTILYREGIFYSNLTAVLTDSSNAIFTASWSASTVGSYQVYSKNETTNLLYISEVYYVVPDCEEIATVYVGI